MKIRTTITKTFNVVLFLYLCFSGVVNYLFDPEGDKQVPWDTVYEWSPSIAIIFFWVIILISAFWGSVLIKIFWNRFIADIFKVRTITYDESLAIILMIAILSI